jgi:putative transferase (TIGR04331 family)
MKRYLITTADERTWPKDQPVLFLGEWCKLYNRRHIWKEMDAETVPYHWDDRNKLYKDYLYLKEIYEELLRELSEWLNEFHHVNHTLRYWRILIGPWLSNFIQILFDRWEMVRRAISDYSIAGVYILDIPSEQVIPNDMKHYRRFFLEENWNETICRQIIQGWTSIPFRTVQSDNPKPYYYVKTGQYSDKGLKNKLIRLVSCFSKMLACKNDVFFINTYMSIRQEFNLQFSLGQLPVSWQSVQPPKAKVDWAQRQWNGDSRKFSLEDFPGVVRTFIPKHIPSLYLEGYLTLQSFCNALPWPKKPRLIFTSVSYHEDDVFKAWAAEKVETGTPLLIGQHGGFFGIGDWDSTEDHQYDISDGWLSWGWDDKKHPQVSPVGNLKMIGYKMEWDPQGYALMVEMAIPRQSYHLYSIPIATQWLDYFYDQCRFVESLPEKIRRSLLVRLYVHDYGWCQVARWKDHFPDVRLDNGTGPIAPLVKKSRIYISTYNATTFLESMALNIPTIIFWSPERWELRDSAVTYFKRLKSVGIFHETPEGAAAKMSEVWENVPAWWKSEPVQETRLEFCDRYSRMSEKPLKDLEQIMRQILNTAGK